MTHQIKRLLVVIVAVFVVGAALASSSGGGGGNMSSTSTTTSASTSSTTTSSGTTTSTSVSSSSQVCTTTTVTDTSGNSKAKDDCSWLRFVFSTAVDGTQIYDSSTGKSGQVTKKPTFTFSPPKPVQSGTFLVGYSAYIGSTKVASNNTRINLGASSSSLKFSPVSLTITGLKLESYSYLYQNGGTLRYVVQGNRTFTFTDGTVLSDRFTGNVGNISLTFQANAPTVITSTDCGGCPLNPSGSAYYIPNGSGTLTLQVVDYKGGAFPAANGGSVSATYLCWDATKLTQPCSISPGSFSGTLNSNAQYSLAVSSVVLGSFNGYYLSGGTVLCCAPQYAPVGYLGSVKFVTPFTLYGTAGTASSLPIQFVVAQLPADRVGGTVYLYAPCTWFAPPRVCVNS